MPKYRIEWVEHVARSAFVEADSESAARQSWIDGSFDYEEQDHVENGSDPKFEVVE